MPKGVLLNLIETPEFQRLRRIRQLGLGHLVFPGAEHTRFQHALGAMALMQEALAVIAEKGTPLPDHTHEAALAAILLHDIGHGPFSHTLEFDLIAPGSDGTPYHHEAMGLAIVERLNRRFDGALNEALAIIRNDHPLRFLHRLLASQLDMDRLDYLRRDSFYTGVTEGIVGVERIIKTLRVHPTEDRPEGDLVIEAKGAYAVESFILSRRLMFWQVYYHKTVIAADILLRSIFNRARQCIRRPDSHIRAATPAFQYFLQNEVKADDIRSEDTLQAFCDLDDTDIIATIKSWMYSPDPVLADLSRRFIHRNLFRTHYFSEPSSPDDIRKLQLKTAEWLAEEGITAEIDPKLAGLYVVAGSDTVSAYSDEREAIQVLERDGRIRSFSETLEIPDVARLAVPSVRHYVCAPKEILP